MGRVGFPGISPCFTGLRVSVRYVSIELKMRAECSAAAIMMVNALSTPLFGVANDNADTFQNYYFSRSVGLDMGHLANAKLPATLFFFSCIVSSVWI